MSYTSKTRQPRLRASCDGCFLAKVKCSKERPLCSRCLACGLDCRYSPSSRASKPKAVHHQEFQPIPEPENSSGYLSHTTVGQLPAEHIFHDAHEWYSPSSSIYGAMRRNSSLPSDISYHGKDAAPFHNERLTSATNIDSRAASMPWTPSLQRVSYPVCAASPASATDIRSLSIEAPKIINPAWHDQISAESMSFNTLAPVAILPINCIPSPPSSATQKCFPGQKYPSSPNSIASCICFTACLQSLQALHNASSPSIPAFDQVLSLNGKAVEGCASMLCCTNCMSRRDIQTPIMLLATIIGKVASLYKTASTAYFEASPSELDSASETHSINYGAYRLRGEDGMWFELEILSRELRKLEEVYSRFREVCSDFADDLEVNRAMIEFLGHDLAFTLEAVDARRERQRSAFVC
ncbi:RNA polymerase II-specific transcription factor-like protein [Microdochium nivale]|nr:RNA polymerase II-specific transcription factor-like protein [Microdochium nivale]